MKQISLSKGVRQGCSLSPYLFILVTKVLASKIRHDKTIQGIKVFKKEIKMSQFADDTSLICKNLTSVGNAQPVNWWKSWESLFCLKVLAMNPTKKVDNPRTKLAAWLRINFLCLDGAWLQKS